jgi:hypothetical protein
MAIKLCKNLEKIQAILLLLILEVHNFLFLPMFLKEFGKNGLLLSLILIVKVIKLSAMFSLLVKMLLQK